MAPPLPDQSPFQATGESRETKSELQQSGLHQVLKNAKDALKKLKDTQSALIEPAQKLRASEAGINDLQSRLATAIEKMALSAVADKHAWIILPNVLMPISINDGTYRRDEMGVDECYLQAVDSLIGMTKDQANTAAFLEEGLGQHLAENLAYFAEENGQDVPITEISNRYRADFEADPYGEMGTIKGYLDNELILTGKIEDGAVEDVEWEDTALRAAVLRIVAEALVGEKLEVDSVPQIKRLKQELAESEQTSDLQQTNLERLTRRMSAQQRNCENLENQIEEAETEEWENAAITALQKRYPQLLLPRSINADLSEYLKRHDKFNTLVFLSEQGAKPSEPSFEPSGGNEFEPLDTQDLEAGTYIMVKKLLGDRPADWETTTTRGMMGERIYLHDPLANEFRQAIQLNCLAIAEANGQELSQEELDGLLVHAADKSGKSTLKFMGETIAESATYNNRTKMRVRPQNSRRAAAKFFLMVLGRKDPEDVERENAALFQEASEIKSKLKDAQE